jgi:hypothetical protein
MDFSLAKIAAIATLLWVLGTSSGTITPYDGSQPPPPPPQPMTSQAI